MWKVIEVDEEELVEKLDELSRRNMFIHTVQFGKSKVRVLVYKRDKKKPGVESGVGKDFWAVVEYVREKKKVPLKELKKKFGGDLVMKAGAGRYIRKEDGHYVPA